MERHSNTVVETRCDLGLQHRSQRHSPVCTAHKCDFLGVAKFSNDFRSQLNPYRTSANNNDAVSISQPCSSCLYFLNTRCSSSLQRQRGGTLMTEWNTSVWQHSLSCSVVSERALSHAQHIVGYIQQQQHGGDDSKSRQKATRQCC